VILTILGWLLLALVLALPRVAHGWYIEIIVGVAFGCMLMLGWFYARAMDLYYKSRDQLRHRMPWLLGEIRFWESMTEASTYGLSKRFSWRPNLLFAAIMSAAMVIGFSALSLASSSGPGIGFAIALIVTYIVGVSAIELYFRRVVVRPV
jgi:hypothetical protein